MAIEYRLNQSEFMLTVNAWQNKHIHKISYKILTSMVFNQRQFQNPCLVVAALNYIEMIDYAGQILESMGYQKINHEYILPKNEVVQKEQLSLNLF